VKALAYLGPLRSFALLCVVGLACSSPEKLGVAGDPCLQFTDCVPALACVKGVCSADVTPIVNIEDAAAADRGSPPDVGLSDTTSTDDGGGQEATSDDGGAAETSSPSLEAGPDSGSAGDEAGRADAGHPQDALSDT
jgi:hypothetical protein